MHLPLSLFFQILPPVNDALGDRSCVTKLLMHYLPWYIGDHSLLPDLLKKVFNEAYPCLDDSKSLFLKDDISHWISGLL